MKLYYYSTCKNKENAETKAAELRKMAYNGHGKFGGYTRYIVKGRKIFYWDGWA